MPDHWTYAAFRPPDDLLQGDVLDPTPELQEILRQVHPHFLDPKYTAFLLITQSCDLAVRNARCDTKYLNIAVVRPLEAVLHDLLCHVCRPVVEGVYLQETKGEARRLLERLFNQNEQALGLFYLHPDLDAGIARPSVALLRVTVALRAEHYAVVKCARRGRLGPEFRNKLGWLVGNLYSRIGTADWSEPPERGRELEGMVSRCLDPGDADLRRPIWVPQALVSAAREKGVQVEQIERKRITSVLEAHRSPPAKAQAIEQVLRVLKTIHPAMDDETGDRIRNRLNNDSLFAKAVRSAKSE